MRRMTTTRRLIKEEYNLEAGELDGMRMKEIYEIVGEEPGSLDRFRFVLKNEKDIEEN